MFKADTLLVSAFQAQMGGNGLLPTGDFYPVHKRFQPQRLVRVFTGDRVPVGFKLDQGGFIHFDRHHPAAFRWILGQGNEGGFLLIQAFTDRLALPGLGASLVIQTTLV